MVRLIYLDMLGYDASFGEIQAVTMAASTNPVLKRVGYLAASVLLGPNHDLALMLTNTMQRDLKSDNYVVVCAALDACCKLMSRDTAPALLPNIEALLPHPIDPVRRKACLAVQRAVVLAPDRLPELSARIRQALLDRDPAVMAAALNALDDAARLDPASLRSQVGPLAHILGQVLQGRLPKSYEYHKAPAPFIQLRVSMHDEREAQGCSGQGCSSQQGS